ncbi:MAG: wax ester/triacylglycerol synthase domain-containing protein [Actinophytocola sp.]|uniref:wax ester/triacylglycerol synthase domain-containing protein n=1 Tax=Actinophytocola sp. TaxID=1872138 RepID=UPI003C76AF21
MDNLSTVPADFLGTAFARLGQIAPDPADTYFGLVFRIAGPCPPVEDLRARVAARLPRLPRLTERLVARASVQWERDPEFDIARHVGTLRRHTGVLSAHEILSGTPDPARPPWGLWTSEDPENPGGWRLYYLVHHARQDAAAALRTVTTLLGDDDTDTVTAAPVPERQRGWPAMLPIALDLLRTKFPGPAVAPKRYGPGRVLAVGEVDVALFTDIAARTGATVNQVHMAAMSSALDRWAPRPEVSRRPVNVPVDTREPGDSDVANRLGFMRVGLPCGDSAPESRLRSVRAAAGRRRTARYRRVWGAITRGGGSPAAGWAMRQITDHTQVAMTLSNLRIAAPLSLMAAPVLAVTGLPWLPPAHACFAFFTTCGDRAALTVLAPEGAQDPAELAAHWSDAVHALHRAYAAQPEVGSPA